MVLYIYWLSIWNGICIKTVILLYNWSHPLPNGIPYYNPEFILDFLYYFFDKTTTLILDISFVCLWMFLKFLCLITYRAMMSFHNLLMKVRFWISRLLVKFNDSFLSAFTMTDIFSTIGWFGSRYIEKVHYTIHLLFKC